MEGEKHLAYGTIILEAAQTWDPGVTLGYFVVWPSD